MGKEFILKDSGKRRTYPSGAVRDTNEGKIRYDLVPIECIKRLAELYTKGAVKYGDNNWKKGIPTKDYVERVCRHWANYRLGEKEEDNLSAVVFNVFGIIYNEEMENKQNAI